MYKGDFFRGETMSLTENQPATDAEDILPTVVVTDANNYLQNKAKDEELLRDFKSKLFWVGLVISCLFLLVGLIKSWTFIGTQLDLAKQTLTIQQKQLVLDEKKMELVQNQNLKPSEIKELNLSQDREERILDSKFLSTGVILTLITVIFAVALTILLNLIKHAFKTENDNKADSATELATPLGNLLLEFIQAIKNKISK